MFKHLKIPHFLRRQPRHGLAMDFLAAISHEIRTPLNGIVATVGLLQQMQLTEKQRQYVDTIQKSSDQLLQEMNNVLDIVKIDSNQFQLDPLPFDIAATTNLALEAFTYECQRKNISLIVRHQPNISTYVFGDPARYRQVLTALLTNAVENIREGHIYFNLSQDQPPSTSGILKYRIEIQDTGSGISPAKLEEIRRQFARSQLSSYHQYEGAGLGLTIANGLIRLMGGHMDIKSEEGKGTTIFLTLPFTAAIREVKPSNLKLPSPAILRGTRALLVNNHTLSRRVTHEVLDACGIQVEEAGTVKEGLTKLKSGRRFDIVLMDTQLLEMETLIKQVKAISVALMVALAKTGQRGDDLRFEKEKFGAYLLKPYTFEEFSTILAIAFARARDKTLPLPAGIATREQLNRLRLHAKPVEPGTPLDFGHVLVIEDDAVNRNAMEIVLNRLGAKPTLADNGKDGMDLFAAGSFNLVLMDMNMPFMNGPEAAREMRKLETIAKRSTTPIIAITASSMKDDHETCLSAGMNDFLTKPVTVEKLQAVMEKWIRL